MLKLTEGDKSYLAGLIDGEGCIFIGKYNGKPPHISSIYSLILVVVMTDETVLRHCQEITGIGSITVEIRRTKHPNWNNAYRWSINKNGAYSLLTQIKEYLILKRGQAETAIEFMKLGNGRTGRGGIVPEYLLNRREELRLRLMAQKKEKPYEIPVIEEKTTQTQLSLF